MVFLLSHLSRLTQDRRGAAVIEYALVVLPFLLTVMCALETGYDLFCSNALDQATQYAARQIMTGAVQSSTTTISQGQFISSYLCPRLPGLFNCSNLIVNIQVFPESVATGGGFSSFLNAGGTYITMPPLNNAQTNYCLGGSGEYVFVQVLYPMPLLTGAFANAQLGSYNGQSVVVLSSGAAFKNEPFPVNSYVPPKGCPT